MDNEQCGKDYRRHIILKWVSSNISTFKKPRENEYFQRFSYYNYLIERFFPKNDDAQILEIGCGFGYFIYSLKKLGYKNIDALDIIPECVSYVTNEFNVNGICEDAISFLRNNNKKYDVIIAFDVVEHFNKEEIVVLTEYIYNSLKDAGIFIMRVPYGGSLGGLYIRYSGFTHEVAFTELSIEELFRTVGFNRIICIPEPDIHPNLIKSSIKKIINKIIVKALGLPMKDPNFIRSINIIGIGFK